MTLRIQAKPPRFVPSALPVNVPVERCPVPREEASHRILIMRVGSNGDVLMGTPLLAALRRNLPNAHITWLVEEEFTDCIDANPYVDEILVWNAMYWKRMVRRVLYPYWIFRCLQFRRQLMARKYDVFISFQPEEWPLLTRFGTGASLRIGVFDTLWKYFRQKRTSRYTALYTHPFTLKDLPPHRTDQYLLVLSALGLPQPESKPMSLGFTAEDAAVVDDYLKERGIFPGSPLLVLAPTTTWQSRCWPAERYIELGNRLQTERPDTRIVVIGSRSPKERPVVEQVAAGLRNAHTAIGNLTFRQMAALLHRSSLVISGDTGPMHVAAAVGTPYLALFGSTPVAGRIPLTGRGLALAHPVPCGPCDREFCANTGDDHLLCMRLLSVDEVYEATIRSLDGTGGRGKRLEVLDAR